MSFEVSTAPPIPATEAYDKARTLITEARANPTAALINHSLLLSIESLERACSSLENLIHTEATTFEQWKEAIPEVSSEYANDAEWCSVFDRGLEQFGMTRINNTPEQVDIDWWTDIEVEYTIPGSDLKEQVEANLDGEEFESVDEPDDVTVTVNVRITGTYEGDEDSCICENLDRTDISNSLPNWVNDWEHNESFYCDNCG